MGLLKSFGVEEGKGKYYEEAIYSLALIHNIITDKTSTYLENFDLTLGKFNILMVIKHQGGEKGIPQVEVSKRLIVTPSNMTKLIDKLEKDGFVTRSALEGDRRVNIMKITAKGSKLLDDIWPGYNKILQDIMVVMDQSNQKTAAVVLNNWLNKLQVV